MGVLGRDQILNAAPSPTTEVEVPEWGGTVLVKPMTAGQRAKVEAVFTEAQHTGKGFDKVTRITTLVAAWCCVDEQGQPLFTENDTRRLEGLDAQPLVRIRRAAFRASGMGRLADDDEADTDAADPVEEAVEDFGATPTGDASTG